LRSYARGGSDLRGLKIPPFSLDGRASGYDYRRLQAHTQDFAAFATETKRELEDHHENDTTPELTDGLQRYAVSSGGGLHEGTIYLSCENQDRRSPALSKCQ
jgi:hypothetical protein